MVCGNYPEAIVILKENYVYCNQFLSAYRLDVHFLSIDSKILLSNAYMLMGKMDDEVNELVKSASATG